MTCLCLRLDVSAFQTAYVRVILAGEAAVLWLHLRRVHDYLPSSQPLARHYCINESYFHSLKLVVILVKLHYSLGKGQFLFPLGCSLQRGG